MGRHKREVGYIAAKRQYGKVVICINEPDGKRYFSADLNEVLEALTGRRAWARLYG